jgi:tetratricopeptide (TPR) repeat protein/NAD-dependent SIR2 family protein deacetylase
MAKKKLTVKDIDHITVRALAKKLKSIDRFVKEPKKLSSAEERRPQLAFFLGAGASFESGIMLAGQMMKIFKEEIFDTHCQELTNDKEKTDWLKKQDWYKSGREEYGCLFEKAFETKTERQRFIEDMIADKAPSFGYVILADLLLRNYVNTVLTTNFDDLIYISSTTFTGNRPIVYAYGILASEMKMLSNHSKVLKLHGDYLYSNIVNTGDEMSKQSQALKEPYNDIKEAISSLNMERQVRTVFDNFGVVVIGYSGGDKTVMELLDNVSKDNGFYWCYVKGYEPDEEVCNLVESKNGKFIEIEGFDALMKGISDVTEFKIDDLLKSIDERKENLKEVCLKFEPEYTKESLKEYAEELRESIADNITKSLSAIDYYIMAVDAQKGEDFRTSEKYYRKAIELNSKFPVVYNNLGQLLIDDKSSWEEAELFFQKAIELDSRKAAPYVNLGFLYSKDKNRWKDAEDAFLTAIKIEPNLSEAYNAFGNFLYSQINDWENAEKYYRVAIKLNPNLPFAHNSLGVLLLQKDKTDEAIKEFELSILLDKSYVNPILSLAAIYKKQDNKSKYNHYIGQVKSIIKNKDSYQKARFYATVEDKEKALKYLRVAIEESPPVKYLGPKSINFDWIRDDPRFAEIVGE